MVAPWMSGVKANWPVVGHFRRVEPVRTHFSDSASKFLYENTLKEQ